MLAETTGRSFWYYTLSFATCPQWVGVDPKLAVGKGRRHEEDEIQDLIRLGREGSSEVLARVG